MRAENLREERQSNEKKSGCYGFRCCEFVRHE